MHISRAIENFIQDRYIRCYTEKTIQNYRDTLSAFMRYTGNVDTSEISINTIRKYQKTLVDRHLSKASVASYIRHIRAFIHWLEEESIIDSDSVSKKMTVPKAPKKNINLLSAEDVKLIFDSITEESEWLRSRDKLIIALMYDSGLRQAEVCKIMHIDIDLYNRRINIHGKGNKDRYVPFGMFTYNVMMEYMKLCPFKTEYLICRRWGQQINEDTIKKMMSKLKARTGIKDLSSHKLRHNFATNYCIDGYNNEGYVDGEKLKTIMGHESIQTTEVYRHEALEIVSSSHFRSHLDSIAGHPD